MKPLGRSIYGSIPHLLTSALGKGDKYVHPGQDVIATIGTRDAHDTVIVQEKLDGCCVSIAKHQGDLLALTRRGYTAYSSPNPNHQFFHNWFNFHKHEFENVIEEGERIVGEWIYQKHCVSYNAFHMPFVAFDCMLDRRRLTTKAFYERFQNVFPLPAIVHAGGAISVVEAFGRLVLNGSVHGADHPEGLIYRVERHGEVDFIAKWVDGGFVPGKHTQDGNFETNNFIYS